MEGEQGGPFTGDSRVLSIKDKAFMEIALRRGSIDAAKLQQAQAARAELEKFGIEKSVGSLLADKNLAPREVLTDIAREMESLVVRCPSCREVNPLSACDHQGNLKCKRCQEMVTLADERISEEFLFSSGAPRKSASKGRGRADPARNVRRQTPPPPAPEKDHPSTLPDNLDPPQGITKFKVGELVGMSPAGRLYRMEETSGFGALKVIDPALCVDSSRLKRWLDLMEKVQDLPASATLKPLRCFREGSTNYSVRPYLAGPQSTLRDWLSSAQQTPPGSDTVLNLAKAILESLNTFHGLHVVHGNLKPENVLLSGGQAQLTDAGIHLLYEALPHSERVVMMWDFSRYLAPEVMQGSEPTSASDVYAAGKILEDILKCTPKEAAGRSAEDAEKIERLRNLVDRMTASDPPTRPASAKEALAELKNGSRKTTAAPRRRTSTVRRIKELVSHFRKLPVLAPALLLLATMAALYLGLSWYRTRSALASPSRAEEISSKFIERDIEELADWTVKASSTYAEAEKRWTGFQNLLRGTAWEKKLAEASHRALGDVQDSREGEAKVLLEKARAEAGQRNWTSALEAALGARRKAGARWDGQDTLTRILEGLYRDLQLVFIPEGDVSLTVAGVRKTVTVPPFLVDPTPFRRGDLGKYPSASSIITAVPVGAPQAPIVGLSFTQAQKLASATGKRLVRAAEWDRMALLSPSADPVEAFAAGKIEGIQGPLLEWVQEGAADRLLQAGYGVCRGGHRSDAPGTHPLRRAKHAGYPDVAVRFAMDLRIQAGKAGAGN